MTHNNITNYRIFSIYIAIIRRLVVAIGDFIIIPIQLLNSDGFSQIAWCRKCLILYVSKRIQKSFTLSTVSWPPLYNGNTNCFVEFILLHWLCRWTLLRKTCILIQINYRWKLLFRNWQRHRCMTSCVCYAYCDNNTYHINKRVNSVDSCTTDSIHTYDCPCNWPQRCYDLNANMAEKSYRGQNVW